MKVYTISMDERKENLEDLGYNSSFESAVKEINLRNVVPARLIAQHKEAYRVKNLHGEFLAKITGKQIFEAENREDYPAVGDWVLITELDSEHAVIEKILPRQTIIKRRYGDKDKRGEKNSVQVIATNIDVGFVIESVTRDYNLNRFERYFSILQDSGIQGAIILNKVDLLSHEGKEEKLNELKSRFPHTDIIMTSVFNNDELDTLRQYIEKGKTYCFLGSSGVGKSSLINALMDKEIIKTNTISSHTDRGKHTTTERQMYFLNNGGIVIDNPGIREVGMTSVKKGVDNFFGEIAALKQNCKYVDCTHTHEPGCAVLNAIKLGKINKERYANYINLRKEAEYYDLTDNQKRQKDKDFGKFINKAKKEFKKIGYNNYQ